VFRKINFLETLKTNTFFLNKHKGKRDSEETRNKKRQQTSAKWQNPEYKERMLEKRKLKRQPMTDGIRIWESRSVCEQELGGGGLSHKLKSGKVWFLNERN
jgi:hypothetical protein